MSDVQGHAAGRTGARRDLAICHAIKESSGHLYHARRPRWRPRGDGRETQLIPRIQQSLYQI